MNVTVTSRFVTLNVTLSVTFQTTLVFAERHVNVTFCHAERDAERHVSNFILPTVVTLNVTRGVTQRGFWRHMRHVQRHVICATFSVTS